jgi:ubiquinone/menaquinone biosynthesis C-methylase UbiE
MSTQGQKAYVMGRAANEYHRLSAQAQLWAPATRSALTRAGLAVGMHALDVGCGTGAAMRLIADVVGPSGRVIGLDCDEALGAEALSRLRSTGPDVFEFIAGDFDAATPIDGQQFGLVLARLLVLHCTDPVKTIRRLWQWVKPGGVLLVMEYDMTTFRAIPAHPVAKKAFDLMCELFRALGKDVEIGSRMPELFRRASIGLSDGCDVWSHIQPNVGGGGMIRMVLSSLRKASLAGGYVDATTLDQIDTELSAIAPDQYLVRWPDMVATWKRNSG